MAVVISNYEKFTPEKKAYVPDKTYRAALVIMKGTLENISPEEVTAVERPENYPCGSGTPECSGKEFVFSNDPKTSSPRVPQLDRMHRKNPLPSSVTRNIPKGLYPL